MSCFLQIAEGFGGLATVGTFIVAVWALSFARQQLDEAKKTQREATKTQREATAKDIYRDYLELAFKNPKFAYPPKFIGQAEGDWKQEGEWNTDEKYRWFVSFMLNSCDEIAQSNAREKFWRDTIFEDLKRHKEYLKSPQFGEDGGWRLYSPELKKIGEEVVKQTREGDGLVD